MSVAPLKKTSTKVSDRNIAGRLVAAGLRPTKQRMVLARLLFGKGGRHLNADMLFAEVSGGKEPVALATVYNTLNQFSEAGLVRPLSIDGKKTYFDTNISSHHHFYIESSHELRDIHDPDLRLATPPSVPAGYEISSVEVMIRIRKRPTASKAAGKNGVRGAGAPHRS